ncbi:MAG: tRNA pseudouridine(38-40) synthase TruA [Tannerella sp.]|jgi:tRNA pseudouridine38-40 synthase|nr:tRNA pseudouridine(38-40) synthase TruA [Tannerella sp.]
MYRYRITLSYNGTRFGGWQIQPNSTSIQQCLQEQLSLLLRQEIEVTGAGRTDAGVHARFMAAHFDCKQEIPDTVLIVKKLNSMLSKDIAVKDMARVSPEFHARFSALSRTYEYNVTSVKNPFAYEWVHYMSLSGMDFQRMNEACNILYEYEDFTSFSKLHTDVKTNNCKIYSAVWKREGDIWVFRIKADRFLRNMVRAIVGTLFDVGRGKITIEDFRNIIEAKDRCRASSSAAARGLSLVAIEYPEDIFPGGGEDETCSF